MATEIDARGLSCPQPVLMFVNAQKKDPQGDFDILVDTDVSRENVTRAAENRGFSVKLEDAGNGEVRLLLRHAR